MAEWSLYGAANFSRVFAEFTPGWIALDEKILKGGR